MVSKILFFRDPSTFRINTRISSAGMKHIQKSLARVLLKLGKNRTHEFCLDDDDPRRFAAPSTVNIMILKVICLSIFLQRE